MRQPERAKLKTGLTWRNLTGKAREQVTLEQEKPELTGTI